jgi:hypothetical protein
VGRARNEPKSAPTIAMTKRGKTATGFSNTLKFQSREAREGSHNKWVTKETTPARTFGDPLQKPLQDGKATQLWLLLP